MEFISIKTVCEVMRLGENAQEVVIEREGKRAEVEKWALGYGWGQSCQVVSQEAVGEKVSGKECGWKDKNDSLIGLPSE